MTANTTQIGGVVYSFQSRWSEQLIAGHISVFFRKKVPKVRPSKIFLYVGSPIKKVVGVAEVVSIQKETISSAIEKKSAACISDAELNKYLSKSGMAYSIEIANLRIFQNAPDLCFLNQNYGFNPPQSFCGMSPEMHKYLEEC